MKRLILVCIALAISTSAAEDLKVAFQKEVSRQEDSVKNQTSITELAHEFVKEARSVVDVLHKAISSNPHAAKNETHRGGRALEEDEDIDLSSLLDAIASVTGERQGREEKSDAQPATSNGNESAAAAPSASDAKTKDGSPYAPPPQTYAPPSTYSAPKPSYSAPSSYKGKQKPKKATIVAPAPILIPIPGPPGLPGPPGIPGLPGLPGKTPSLRGLRAILLAKIAKLWLLAKAVAVLCLAKFGGNLALILALVLPLYGKLKKAGVVLPVHEQPQQPAYEAAPVYESAPYEPEPAPYAQPAPYPDSYVNSVQDQAVAGIENGQAAYEAPQQSFQQPQPSYQPPPHRRRR